MPEDLLRQAAHWLRLPYQQVICVVKGGLLIIKRWEPHALEMPSVTLFPPHHDPHGSPLCYVDGLNHQRDLVNEADSSSNVIQYPNVFDLHTRVSQCASGSMLDNCYIQPGLGEGHPLYLTLTCCQGIGMFSNSLYTACGTNFRAPRYTRLSCLNFLDDISPWSCRNLHLVDTEGCCLSNAAAWSKLQPNLHLLKTYTHRPRLIRPSVAPTLMTLRTCSGGMSSF